MQMAETLGMRQSGISDIESGAQRLTDAQIGVLCVRFRVNAQWLLIGQGDMFLEDAATILKREGLLKGAVISEASPEGYRTGPSRKAALEAAQSLVDLLKSESGQPVEAVADGKHIIRLPILAGRIAAGPPTEVDESKITDWAHCLRAHIPHPSKTTCVRVDGDSMEPNVPDGSLVGIDHAESDPARIARAKDPYAAVRDPDGEGCVIRAVRQAKAAVFFEPTNPGPDHSAWTWTPVEGSPNPIIGKVVFIYRACR